LENQAQGEADVMLRGDIYTGSPQAHNATG